MPFYSALHPSCDFEGQHMRSWVWGTSEVVSVNLDSCPETQSLALPHKSKEHRLSLDPHERKYCGKDKNINYYQFIININNDRLFHKAINKRLCM